MARLGELRGDAAERGLARMETLVRFSDYERKSREPKERDPGALPVVVILPVVRIERHTEKPKRKKR